MTDEKVTVEIWKKIIDVQQHFNDLELRIRNFALVVTGAFLAFGGSAIKEATFVMLFGVFPVSVAALIVFAAVVPLSAFYFMDKYWYHRLLDGAVKAGAAVETELMALGYAVELGANISKASPIENHLYGKRLAGSLGWFPRRMMHSRHKMDVFYGMLFVSLIIIGLSIAFGVGPQSSTSPSPAHHLSLVW